MVVNLIVPIKENGKNLNDCGGRLDCNCFINLTKCYLVIISIIMQLIISTQH